MDDVAMDDVAMDDVAMDDVAMDDEKALPFWRAWHFLQAHPAFANDLGAVEFLRALDIQPVLVNPRTLRIDDPRRNTRLQICLECGRWSHDDRGWSGYTHDLALDCGADTFEEAIVALAALVRAAYGEYDPHTPSTTCDVFR